MRRRNWTAIPVREWTQNQMRRCVVFQRATLAKMASVMDTAIISQPPRPTPQMPQQIGLTSRGRTAKMLHLRSCAIYQQVNHETMAPAVDSASNSRPTLPIPPTPPRDRCDDMKSLRLRFALLADPAKDETVYAETATTNARDMKQDFDVSNKQS